MRLTVCVLTALALTMPLSAATAADIHLVCKTSSADGVRQTIRYRINTDRVIANGVDLKGYVTIRPAMLEINRVHDDGVGQFDAVWLTTIRRTTGAWDEKLYFVGTGEIKVSKGSCAKAKSPDAKFPKRDRA